MKERPILFSAPMVRAILEGRKTQTRRVVKPQPDGAFTVGLYNPTMVDRKGEEYAGEEVFGACHVDGEWGIRCPYGKPGDRLWVREGIHCDIDDGWVYDADGGTLKWRPEDEDAGVEWLETRPAKRSSYPSIHVPRMFSRLTLEVVSVRVERVRDITGDDAKAEGFDPMRVVGNTSRAEVARERFLYTFFSINKRAKPDANPWVWVVEFRRVSLPRAAEGLVLA